MGTPTNFNALIEVSRRYGGDPAFLLAGGGNTSIKDGDRLWVKASGHALATIGPDGFVELDRKKLDAMLCSGWPSDPKTREAAFVEAVMAARVHPELGQRPSVEALLHHLLPERYVVHTHPRIVNSVTCCIHGPILAESYFGSDVLWQPYVDPGLVLAKSLKIAIAVDGYVQSRGDSPDAVLLANHGLIVSGDSIKAVDRITSGVTDPIRERLDASEIIGFGGEPYDNRSGLLDVYERALHSVKPGLKTASDDSSEIRQLVRSKAGRDAALSGPLTPDQIVYCRSLPLWIESPILDEAQAVEQCREAWAAYQQRHGFEPWVGLIAGVGLVAFRDSSAMAKITRCIHVDAAYIYLNATRLGGVLAMSGRDRRFIEEWEVEAYRRSVASGIGSIS